MKLRACAALAAALLAAPACDNDGVTPVCGDADPPCPGSDISRDAQRAAASAAEWDASDGQADEAEDAESDAGP